MAVENSENKDPEKLKMSGKRKGYLEWNEYFMAIAFLSAQRSKDPRTQVGACIVNGDKKIVGIGYNGMPIGCDDDIMPWNRAENESKDGWFESKAPYVCHAELNAVLNKNLADVKGCVIYVALFPCNMCAQIIIQSRISEVIYYSDKYHDRLEFKASRRMFDTAGVKYRQFKPRQEKIIIDFDLIEQTLGESPAILAKDHTDSNNMKLTAGNDSSDTANNNSGYMESFKIGSHPEQPQLQDFAQLLTQEPLPEITRPPGTSGLGNMHEHNYAFISTLFFLLMAILIWYINNSYTEVGVN